VFDALNTSPSASHTFTYTETGGANSIGVACFSDVKATSPHDQENGAATASTDVTISTGNALPTLNNELVITGTTLYITGDSIPSGFTVIDSSTYAGGAFLGLAWAYKVQTTATTENATWAGSGNNTYRAAAIETYFHN